MEGRGFLRIDDPHQTWVEVTAVTAVMWSEEDGCPEVHTDLNTYRASKYTSTEECVDAVIGVLRNMAF